MRRWIGLAELVEDAVHHGATGIERVHREVARGPLTVLVRLPALAPAARIVDVVQDGIIASVYASVRAVNAAVAALVKAALRAADCARDELSPPAQRHLMAPPASSASTPP